MWCDFYIMWYETKDPVVRDVPVTRQLVRQKKDCGKLERRLRHPLGTSDTQFQQFHRDPETIKSCLSSLRL